MRFVVLGAGAIGGALGGRLARAGHEVVLIARGTHRAAIDAGGLRLEAPDGVVSVGLATVERAADITWTADDVVLLALKTQDIAAALGELAACAGVTAATPIVCLTNGLEAERLALRWFRSVHAVCVMSETTFVEPGVIQQWCAKVRGVLDLGRLPEGPDDLDHALAAAFRSAGYLSEPRGDILRWKRGKLLVNLSNGLEAMCGRAARTSALATMARLEGVACFEAAGLPRITEAEEAARRVDLTLGEIAGRTRQGGSAWQSLARGARALECDYLNGEIALLGRLHGVATPVNDLIQRLSAAAARDGRAAGSMAIDDILAQL